MHITQSTCANRNNVDDDVMNGTLILQPNALGALDALDPTLLPPLTEAGVPTASGSLLLKWAVLRNTLLAQCKSCENIHFYNGHTISSITEDKDCVEVKFSNSDKSLTGFALVGADGINSFVRQHLQLAPFRKTDPSITTWKGMCDTTNETTVAMTSLVPLVSNGVIPVYLRLQDSILTVVNIKSALCWSVTTKQTITESSKLMELFPVGASARGGFLCENLSAYAAYSNTDLIGTVELSQDVRALLKQLFDCSTAVTHHEARVIDFGPAMEACCGSAQAGAESKADDAAVCTKRVHGLGQQWEMEGDLPTKWSGSNTRRITLIGDAAHAFFSDDGQPSAMALEDAVVLVKHIQNATEAGETSKKMSKKLKGSNGKGSPSFSISAVDINFENFESERIPRVVRMRAMQDKRLVEMFTETGPVCIDKHAEQFMFCGMHATGETAGNAGAEHGWKMA